MGPLRVPNSAPAPRPQHTNDKQYNVGATGVAARTRAALSTSLACKRVESSAFRITPSISDPLPGKLAKVGAT